jgi:hypothetical protein
MGSSGLGDSFVANVERILNEEYSFVQLFLKIVGGDFGSGRRGFGLAQRGYGAKRAIYMSTDNQRPAKAHNA